MNTELRRDPRIERTRGALIAAGRKLFSTQPVDAVTVDNIVRAAGVAKGSFYNHFADREALVRAIATEIRGAIECAIDRANLKVEDAAHRLARASCTYLRFALDEPERARFLIRAQGGHTSLDAPLNRGLVRDISTGIEVGRFRGATLEAGVLYVLGVNEMALVRIAQTPSLGLAVGMARRMCAMMLSGLRVPESDADLIAAQTSDEIVGMGMFAATFAEPGTTNPG